MAGDDRSTDSLLFRSLTLPPPHQDNTHSLLLINFQCLKPGAHWKSFSRLCVIIRFFCDCEIRNVHGDKLFAWSLEVESQYLVDS